MNALSKRYNGVSFSWRCAQLWAEGHSTAKIAEITESERMQLPGKTVRVTEAKVYNALAKARNTIYERGLTMPRVRGGEVKQLNEGGLKL